jgi:hypothetical protein
MWQDIPNWANAIMGAIIGAFLGFCLKLYYDRREEEKRIKRLIKNLRQEFLHNYEYSEWNSENAFEPNQYLKNLDVESLNNVLMEEELLRNLNDKLITIRRLADGLNDDIKFRSAHHGDREQLNDINRRIEYNSSGLMEEIRFLNQSSKLGNFLLSYGTVES